MKAQVLNSGTETKVCDIFQNEFPCVSVKGNCSLPAIFILIYNPNQGITASEQLSRKATERIQVVVSPFWHPYIKHTSDTKELMHILKCA